MEIFILLYVLQFSQVLDVLLLELSLRDDRDSLGVCGVALELTQQVDSLVLGLVVQHF